MLLVFAAALAIWAAGALFGVPRAARWLMLALLYVAVLAALTVLPEGAPLRGALGGSVALWLFLGGFAALGGAYAIGLRYLRRLVRPENRASRAPATAAPDPEGPLSEDELARYARHIVLRELGGPGQRRLRRARVLVVGAGGLGSPALLYLAGAGTGTLGVIDDDTVDVSNLQRQIIHATERQGMPKVFSAAEAIRALNPHVLVRPYNRRLTAEIAADLVAGYDLVLDGTDDVETRYLVNRACIAARVPLVSGAISQWEGQLAVFDPARGGPCYRCAFPEPAAPGLAPSCAEGGVAGPLPGVIGAMMALEAVKIIAGIGQPARGEMLLYDGLWGETRRIRLARRPDCPDCGAA